jgi:hypothetical protein
MERRLRRKRRDKERETRNGKEAEKVKERQGMERRLRM